MTVQERRFKVTKIDKYKSQISIEEGKIEKYNLGILITALFAIDILAKTMELTPSDAFFYIGSILGGGSVIGSLAFLKRMIKAISKKTILESKIEDLNEEIEFEKSRGVR